MRVSAVEEGADLLASAGTVESQALVSPLSVHSDPLAHDLDRQDRIEPDWSLV